MPRVSLRYVFKTYFTSKKVVLVTSVGARPKRVSIAKVKFGNSRLETPILGQPKIKHYVTIMTL